jgi:hypothetical protein
VTLNYADLFADIGKLIKYYNLYYTVAQNQAGYVNAIETEFATDNQEAAISGLNPGALNNWLNNYVNRRQTLAGYAQNRMQDPASVLAFIGATNSNMSTVMPLFITQMTNDTETINRSTTSIGSVTASGANTGNGTIIPTLTLDGQTNPGSRAGISFPSHYLYAGLSSELCISETMELICSSDSYSGNTNEGAEKFAWSGALADVAYGVDAVEGSGAIGTITAIHGNTGKYLNNADFETFTVANTPTNWTTTGTIGTNIFQNTTSGDFYHGLSALQLTGDGSTTTMGVSQLLKQCIPGKAYCCTVRIKSVASVSAGSLLINLTGTGYTSSANITIAHGSLPTSWALYSFIAVLPANAPDNVALTIAWSGTPTSAKSVYIDDIGFDAVNYGAGIGMIVVRGSTPFVKNDTFSVPLTATEAVIQKYWRQTFGYMLPSTASSPSIADSVAS